jgi:hypothetical protein
MSGLSEELRRFIDDPGAWALPHRAAAWIAPGLSAATAGQLLGSPRLAARTSALLAERLGRGDAAALAPDDARLAVANPAALAAVARSAGAIVHAARLRTLVMAADIAALEARIGAAVGAAARGCCRRRDPHRGRRRRHPARRPALPCGLGLWLAALGRGAPAPEAGGR